MKPARSKLLICALMAFLPVYWIGSEFYYAHSIRPGDQFTVADYFRRFGEPRYVFRHRRGEIVFYEFQARLRSPFILAIPSSTPSYVFEESGRMADWCRDPGDNPSWFERWPRTKSDEVDMATIRKEYGL